MLLLIVAGTAACVSTDATSDIQRSQEFLAQRAGLAADWLAPIESIAAWDPATPLTSDIAVAATLARSPELRARVEEVARSRAELIQAGLLPNPVLSLSLGFPIAGADGGTTIGASLVQNLASVFSIEKRKDAATQDLQRAILQLSDHAIDAAASARTLHAHIVFADQAAAFAQESSDLLGRSLELTQRRVDAGEASRLDLNRVRVLHLQAEVEASQLRAESEAARRELLVLMGSPDADATFGVEPAAADTSQLPPEAEVIRIAQENRLDVAAAQAAANAAAQRAGIAAKSRFDLEAGADYERDEDGRDTLGPAIDIPIPIFDTGDAKIAIARAEARAAAHAAEQARQAAIGQARVAWVRARADAAAAARFATDIVELADDNLGLAQQAYDAGEEDLTVLLETQRSRIAAKLELLRLRERAVRSRIELARAVGGSLPAEGAVSEPAAAPAAQ
jgi:outer membrane protein TolC